jgi:aspartyl-tRNA(Asn)/glutamyl-tRNA(Gln) amidotransferase subunit A
VIANLVGIPAISIPCGLTKSGLPIGIQLTAKLLDEPTLFAVAKRLEYILNEKQVWKLHKSKQNA